MKLPWFPRIGNVQDVASRQLCTGCGVCAFLHPDRVKMVDDPRHGRRPQVDGDAETDEGLEACPGVGLERRASDMPAGLVEELLPEWGPVLEVLEGYASDETIRLKSSSGGAATALALYGLEAGSMHGVLHTRPGSEDPTQNETCLSRGRDDLMAAVGSRYSPASPCDGLQLIEDAAGPCIFIGKPCDVAATRNAAELREQLAKNLGLTINMFCAGTPSTNGTRDLLAQMKVESDSQLERVTYRGEGWPGDAEVEGTDRTGPMQRRMSYEASWGILQRFRQWRCYVCMDHTGEFADVSVGDPWYREIQSGEPGRSLVVIRSERGREFVHAAMKAGYLRAKPVSSGRLPDSQPNLKKTQASVWGRIITCRALGIPAPIYRGIPMLWAWRKHLTSHERAQSIYGTLKRIVVKSLYRRVRSIPPRVPGENGGSGGSG